MDADTFELARMIYSEVGSTDYDTMVKVGSTALNRMDAKKPKEFGETLAEVINRPNAYYAIQNRNDPYLWSTTGMFPNKDEENTFKQAMSIAYGLKTNTISRQEGQFFFTGKEITKMKKKKTFDFSKVKEVGKTEKYKFFSY